MLWCPFFPTVKVNHRWVYSCIVATLCAGWLKTRLLVLNFVKYHPPPPPGNPYCDCTANLAGSTGLGLTLFVNADCRGKSGTKRGIHRSSNRGNV